jgi:hypothetical protein
LPPRTGSGRKRARNENGWSYIAHQYEKRLCMEKKALRDGISFEEVQQRENEKVQRLQKEYRRKSRNQNESLTVGNANVSDGTTTTDNREKLFSLT